ncbi:Translation initiation factor IF-2 [Lachnellula suecica]|uniref:Translation initiation factor IF-2, mitochondrial n=1 Tax=Lachnellula suecica TaxID=602035 RepID=A0A8T9C6S6_9HELO|nr:Translation initiation factor IF-2 [Lachnellula suecica]
MRGRSLLKESTSPSVCAFCAHRLGQVRRSSHVQRRFLQSSRAVSKPPGEAAEIREDNNSGGPGPGLGTWGRSNAGKGSALGSTPSWGGGGGGRIPPRKGVIPAANWGKPSLGSNDIPAKQAQESAVPGANLDEPTPSGNPVLARQSEGSTSTPSSNVMPAQLSDSSIVQEVRTGELVPYENTIPVAPAQDDRSKEAVATDRLSPHEQPPRSVIRPVAAWAPAGFGKGRTPVKSGANWGTSTLSRDGIPAARSQEAGPTETAAADALSPHERRARDSAMEEAARKQKIDAEAAAKAQQRPVSIRTGYGPRATRAGRPDSPQMSAEERRYRERQAFTKEQAREAQNARGGGPVIRHMRSVSHHVMGDGPLPPLPLETREDESGWAQLRRTADIEAEAKEAVKPVDRFAEGRAQREEEAKFRRFTPLDGKSAIHPLDARYIPPFQSERRLNLNANPPSETGRGESILKAAQQAVPQQPLEASFKQWESQEQRARPDSPHIPDKIVSWSPLSSGGTRSATHEETKEVEPKKDDYEPPPAVASGRRLSSRFSAEPAQPSYGKQPKGKDRDKAKRREKFAFEDEVEDAAREEARERAEMKKQRKREKAVKKAVPIILPEYISVANLAVALRIRLEDFIEKMEELGFEETNHDFILSSENAGLIAMEYNYDPIIDRGDSEDLKAREPAVDPSVLPPRPPVVTIMGHVDHGKTTILDYLRKSSVAATEHGGITQHIGAFSVPMPSGKTITFLDTPGHAAFLNMRQRGAVVTDIVILVVAADDSVKPQTIEAIRHAKGANVPIMVAINKIDKEEANIDRVKQDLARHGVDVEDYGGDTQVVCVSGKTGQGMDELEEAAVALSDILDMRAETDGQAEGWVLEASIKSMGKVATVLVRRGTMRPGDFIVAGKTWARIRCLRNEAGLEIDEAGPGTPVEIDGWREQPLAGDEVLQAFDEQKAKSVIDYRNERDERDRLAEDMEAINESRRIEQEKREREKAEAEAEEQGVELDAIPEQKPGGAKQVYFIVKGDVSGSVEAVLDSIAALGTKEVQPHILRSGVGQLSEFDVEHAAAAKGHVVNFNTEVDPHISRAAEQAKVSIISENIIYRLVDEVKAELSKHLPPLVTQKVLGEAEIAQVFSITVKGRQQKNIAGCKVRNGTIGKNAKIRVMRKGEKVFDGHLASLKNVKKDVMEMKKGSECGIGFLNWFEFQVGDQVQAYDEKEEKRYL